MNDQRAHQRMMETTTFKQQKACVTKVRYPSKRNAVGTARKALRGELHAYRCPLCKGWHLGHDRPWLPTAPNRTPE